MFAATLPLEWTEIILAIGILVIVPLGLANVTADPISGVATPHLALLRRLHPIAALPAVASFLFDSGGLAGFLTAPWLAFTIAFAAIGAGRMISRDTLATAAIGIDAGLMFIVVGGGWLTLSRLGLNPMGFDDIIVRLTAVHFHYAGFALPIVAGATARDRLVAGMPAWVVPAGTIVGVPLTALGITTGGWLEWIAATLMALVGLAVAAQLFAVARDEADRLARLLLTVAATALSIGMALAITYAWFVWFNIDGLPIDRMARTHGSLNAFGFGLLGLIGLLRRSAVTRDALTRDALTRDALTEAKVDQARAATETVNAGTTLGLRWGNAKPTDLLETLNLPTATAATEHGVLAKSDGRTNVWTQPIDQDRFDAAVDGIKTWAGHDAAGIMRAPAHPEVVVGTELAMTIPAFGPFNVTATCRIVEVIDEVDRFGFTYATLPHHIVEGVETFLIVRDADTARVEVTAHWRPLAIAARMAPPVTKFLQGRAIGRFLDGIATHRTAERVEDPVAR